jgi:hypothetical protein
VPALLVFALGIRLAFLVLAGADAPLTGDELAYQQLAENFAAGRGLYQTNNPFFPGQVLYAWQAPLYPLSLGALYRVLGSSVLPGKLYGVIVSTATVYVMLRLARRVGQAEFFHDKGQAQDGTRFALVAAYLVALYPGFLTNAHLLLSETLFVFLLLLAFALAAEALARRTPRMWLWILAAGAAWGLATLTRGLTLYFTPFFALWLGWQLGGRDKRGEGQSGEVQGGRARPGSIGLALLFVIGAVSVVAPWTARNYQQFGQFVVLETKGGVNLWLGNSPYTPAIFIRDVWKVGVREPMLRVLPAGEVERDRAAYGLALDFIRAAPLTFLARVPVKFADFWGFERNLADIADATLRGGGWNSAAKIGSDLFAMLVYLFVMVAGTAGWVLAPGGRWKILLGGFTLYFLFVHLVIFGDGRFHLPLIPFFAFYAAWMITCFRRHHATVPRLLTAGVLLLALALVWAREVWAALVILRG